MARSARTLLLLAATTALIVVVATLPTTATAFVIPPPTTTIKTKKATRTIPSISKSPSLSSSLFSSVAAQQPTVTELPDSLDDSAARAALAAAAYYETTTGTSVSARNEDGSAVSMSVRCRVDFDTSIGDETYTLLKQSTEFMQKFVSALCYATIPSLQQQRQDEMMRVISARAELQALQQQQKGPTAGEEENASDLDKQDELMDIIARNGRDPDFRWEGPTARIYFPDEGNAALARRDWLLNNKVPPCVEFASCGGVQSRAGGKGGSNDELIFFFCPKASESESVEQILNNAETAAAEGTSNANLKIIVFVNPNLVDMGVTGFGMAGRRLRERLIDPLQKVYYLRTLSWGALTRQWPNLYTVWQEDADATDGSGYRLIRTLERLPSNPEVEDIYDEENGNREKREGGGMLDQLGDFMQGMMRL